MPQRAFRLPQRYADADCLATHCAAQRDAPSGVKLGRERVPCRRSSRARQSTQTRWPFGPGRKWLPAEQCTQRAASSNCDISGLSARRSSQVTMPSTPLRSTTTNEPTEFSSMSQAASTTEQPDETVTVWRHAKDEMASSGEALRTSQVHTNPTSAPASMTGKW